MKITIEETDRVIEVWHGVRCRVVLLKLGEIILGQIHGDRIKGPCSEQIVAPTMLEMIIEACGCSEQEALTALEEYSRKVNLPKCEPFDF